MSDKFVDRVARSARLYQRGLITAQEFTNVTVNDLHRFDDERCRARHDGEGRLNRERPPAASLQPLGGTQKGG